MEKRKIQQVGRSTLTVSLPKSWTKHIGLKKGDLVTCSPEEDGSIRLTADAFSNEESDVTKEFVIKSDLCDEPRMLERVVIANYILGRDTLRIVSSKRTNSLHAEEVRGMVKRLIGLGIMEESPKQIVLQCSIDPSKFNIETLMRRLSVIVSTMHGDALQALWNFDRELARETIRREDEANMIYWLITRLLLSAQRSIDISKKIGLQDPLQIPDNRMISKYLEAIADNTENMAKRVLELIEYKKKVPRDVIERIYQLGEMAHTIFQSAMDCVFTGDIKIANTVLEMRQVVDLKEEKLRQELPNVPYLGAIALCITRIAEKGAGIAVIALDRALEDPSELCRSLTTKLEQRKRGL